MKRIISAISAALICLHVSADERPLSFSYLSQEDGLSSMSTNDIYPDPTGVIWIATAVGLDCYDGNTIRTIPPPAPLKTAHRTNSRNSLQAAERGIFMSYTAASSLSLTPVPTNLSHSTMVCAAA